MRIHIYFQGLLAALLVATATASGGMPSPLEMILAPEGGDAAIDHQIAATQAQIRAATKRQRPPLVEELGWTFVSKARVSNDPGYYKLAEQCSAWLAAATPADPSGLLLRGHILDAMHRFHEAQAVGEQLVKSAPYSWESFALLGDALMEQGRLDEAVQAYQSMVNLKPCSQAYLRIAHIRWLTGDLPGALETARLAVEAGSTRDPEPAAWAYTRLALYQWQANDGKDARWSIARALQFVPRYAPALLLRGRILLFEKKYDDAVSDLAIAAKENPLPDYRWTLADAQRAAGQSAAAGITEASLASRGAIDDPRTYALYLATRGAADDKSNADTALKLAHAELDTRHDIFTQDAVAWADLAAGRVADAQIAIHAALAEGTQDARLFLHAGLIAAAAGQRIPSAAYLQQASALQQMLLPSERELLSRSLGETSTISQPTTTSPQTAAAATPAPQGAL